MSAVLTRAGRMAVARGFTRPGDNASSPLMVRLFTNDYTPTVTSEAGDFTQASFGGYTHFDTTYADIGGPTLDGDDAVLDLGDGPMVWDCASSPQTVRGWYLYDDDSGDVLAAEKYTVPHVLEVGSRHTLYASIRVGQCG